MIHVCRKIRRKGFKAAFQALGRRIHSRLFRTGYGLNLITPILEELSRNGEIITLVEVGANVGNTDSDPLYRFIKERASAASKADGAAIRALLIEPVEELFSQLGANYRDCRGVTCVNKAVSESAGVRSFYRFRTDIDLVALRLPQFAHQLGSFDKSNITAACPSFSAIAEQNAFYDEYIVETKVHCATLSEILSSEGISCINMLIIDAEGYDYQILKTIDFPMMAPSYINYERTHLGRDEAACRKLLLKNGYSLRDHGDDTLCIKKEISWQVRARETLYGIWIEAIFPAKTVL